MAKTHTPKPPGRPGLQRQDVADALDALIERGIREPSLAQLRQHLGRGSNGTISRLRTEIRGERLLATRTPIEGSVESSVLPVLVSAMERLGEEAAKAADDQVNEMRAGFEAAQSKMARERDEAIAAAHDIRIELATRAEQVKDLRDTIKALRAEVADERKRLDRADAERHTLKDQNHALSGDVNRLTDERDRLEKTLKDQSDALDKVGAAHDTLQAEIVTITTTNTDLESALATRTETVESGLRLIEELRTSQAALEQRAIETEQDRAAGEAAATATIKGLENRLADHQRTIESLIEKVGNGQ